MRWLHGRGWAGVGASAWPLALALVGAWAAPLARPAAAQDFSGNGATATRAIPLPEGVVPFEVQHQGSGHYRFQLVDESGRLVQDLLNGSGVADGSGEMRVPRTGLYRIDVTGSGPWEIHLHPPAAASPGTEMQASAPEGDTRDTAAVPAGEQGRRAGLAAGRASVPWSWGWFGTGLAAGLVSGPLGTTVATLAAGHGAVRLPGDSAALDQRGPDYGRGWRAGFVSGAIGARRESALVGGLAGTLVFGYAILRLSHLGSQGGATGSPPGGPPGAILIGVRF